MSEAKLFVKLGRSVLSVDPTVNTQQSISVQESREVEMNSIVEVLDSRTLAEQVVSQLGAKVVLGESRINPQSLEVRSVSLTEPPPIAVSHSADFEEAVKVVKDSFGVFAPRKTTIVTLRYKAGSPELAQAVTNAFLDSYLREHARVNRTLGSYEFFVAQEAAAKSKLKSVSDAFRDAKNAIGVASIEGRRSSLQGQISSVESSIVMAETDLATARGGIASLEESIEGLPERRLSAETSGFPNQAADQMRHQLYIRQTRLAELRSKYTDLHPEVIAMQYEVANSQKILDEQPVARVQRTEGANPAREKLEQELLSERAKAASFAARVTELRSQYETALAELRLLNHHEVQLAAMEREVQQAENAWRDYAGKLEQSRLDNAIDSQRISNVNILQRANYVAKPISPKRTMVGGFGLIFGLTSALGVALLSEFLSPSLTSVEEVQSQLSVPVFLSLPRVSPGSTLLN
ncbi:GumC family protein [Lignipirellula cremea]|nr:hypothetical protein [Lignipirellula cremea]